ncbi:hypothetical protein L9F63_020103, partial [Diploptera punctata]
EFGSSRGLFFPGVHNEISPATTPSFLILDTLCSDIPQYVATHIFKKNSIDIISIETKPNVFPSCFHSKNTF